jgi:hypothetical protein
MFFAFDDPKQGVSHSNIMLETLITLASRAVETAFSTIKM